MKRTLIIVAIASTCGIAVGIYVGWKAGAGAAAAGAAAGAGVTRRESDDTTTPPPDMTLEEIDDAIAADSDQPDRPRPDTDDDPEVVAELDEWLDDL